MNSSPNLAKLSRPSQADVIQRERLFSQIDKGRKRPILWVTSPAGSGKTTLVASWLTSRKHQSLWYHIDERDGDLATFFYYMGLAAKKTAPRQKESLPLLSPEYLLGIPTFTKRYFEILYSRLKPPFTVVLDNYQDAPFRSGFHEMMAHAFDVIPEGINIIVISREEPPIQLSRVRANNKIHFLAWDDVRFTPDESAKLMDIHGCMRLTAEIQKTFHEKTEGWAAGLVLMMENACKGELHSHPHLNTQRGVFDYFASEVFSKSDKVVQEVLLKTSFLSKIEPTVAVKLTSIDSAGKILERFSRSHYFTQRYMESYRYHPLFREFLLLRAQNTFAPVYISLIQRNAAELMEEAGQVEDAAHLYRTAQDWGNLARLIMHHAKMLVSQSRTSTLQEWIAGLPKTLVEESPWLLYWKGVCCLPSDPATSRQLLENAHKLFVHQHEDVGALLSWAAVVQAYFFEWHNFDGLDPLIQWFENYSERKAPFPSPEIEAMAASAMTHAMFWRRRSSPELVPWMERATRLAKETGDANLLLQAWSNSLLFYIFSGDFANGKRVADHIARTAQSHNVPVQAKVLCGIFVTFEKILTMSTDDPLGLVAENVKKVEESGIHVWDPIVYTLAVSGALNAGELKTAGMYLDKMKTSLAVHRSVELAQFHLLSAWYYLLQNDLKPALTHAEQALQFIADSGSIHEALYCAHLEKAQVLHEQGDDEGAMADLKIVSEYARKSESSIVEYMYLVVEAQFALDKGDHKSGLEYVKKAMELGSTHRYFSMLWWWRPNVMAKLCSMALHHGIEVEYVHELIRKRGLVADGSVANWPYRVKIYTRGKFEIEKDGKPIEFKGKVQKKPIELLKLIVDCGGHTTEEYITDILWHNVDGDFAHNSFKMTLSRLRTLIGKESVKYQSGKVSLNPDYCWHEALEER